MIGIVIVSHSEKLAEGVCELAQQMSQGKVAVVAAGGTDDPANPIGTDAFKVQSAIESVLGDDGVLVLMDLGSAVLSAETALDFLTDDQRARVRLCAAPLVEGAVVAAGLALAGADLDEIVREAQGALTGKSVHLEPETSNEGSLGSAASGQSAEEIVVKIRNRLGLHARPAVQFIRSARRFQARVKLQNLTEKIGPVEADSINGILSLGARRGHELAIRAQGPDAKEALAALATFVESGFGEDEEGAEIAAERLTVTPVQQKEGELVGIPASVGFAVGPAVQVRPAAVNVTSRQVDDPEAERQRFLKAIRAARAETQRLREWTKARAGEKAAAIFDAHLLFLEDVALIDGASEGILEQRVCAEFVWQTVVGKLEQRFHALKDDYLRARAADVVDVGQRVLRRLVGEQTALASLREPSVLLACDLTPSEVNRLDPEKVLGLCLETGSASAHSIILARAMGIPAVVGLGASLSAITDGTVVGLDGKRGLLLISPDTGRTAQLEIQREEWLAAHRDAQSVRHELARTSDGHRIRVLANVNGVAGVQPALDSGAEGIGVLRTEFLFLERLTAPTEEEQLAAYSEIVDSLGPHLLVIRTMDVGGDKDLPYMDMGEEANPFLGWRGIRVSLDRQDLFRTQLRAILRASPRGSVEVLFPMVSSLREVRAAKAILQEVTSELKTEDIPFDRHVRVGAMIEVPAAVAIADQLAAEVDFFSIGTNDLIQYAMAADRTNARVAAIADPLQPAVLRMIRDTVRAAQDAGIGVALCGELAGDALAAPLLLGLGLKELSLSAPLIPEVKQAIARTDLAAAGRLAAEALALDSADAVRQLLQTGNSS